MPAFTLTPKQAGDIAAYVAWLQPVEHGKRLVVENCAACHATGATGESPHLAAPPFRELWRLYPIDALEEAFVEGIETGHPDMPSFEASPEQITDILAYIRSIQDGK
jgi:mono/diheme cytochrome c family protein